MVMQARRANPKRSVSLLSNVGINSEIALPSLPGLTDRSAEVDLNISFGGELKISVTIFDQGGSATARKHGEIYTLARGDAEPILIAMASAIEQARRALDFQRQVEAYHPIENRQAERTAAR